MRIRCTTLREARVHMGGDNNAHVGMRGENFLNAIVLFTEHVKM
jgi:hypothetical protein